VLQYSVKDHYPPLLKSLKSIRLNLRFRDKPSIHAISRRVAYPCPRLDCPATLEMERVRKPYSNGLGFCHYFCDTRVAHLQRIAIHDEKQEIRNNLPL
jgi:hypothetical protein